MLNTVLAVVKNGKIELTEQSKLEEGAKVLVTFLRPEDEHEFWLNASQTSAASIWDNEQDDAYAELLKK